MFAICVSILAIGKYNILDSLIKIIVIVLVVSTVSAFLFALYNGPIEPVEGFHTKRIMEYYWNLFLTCINGVDACSPLIFQAWNSLWTLERMKQTNYKPKLKETLFEFRLTYFITGILAVMFVTLGSFIFYGSGEELPNDNAHFAQQDSNAIHSNNWGMELHHNCSICIYCDVWNDHCCFGWLF